MITDELVEKVARAICEAQDLDWNAQADSQTSGAGAENEQEHYFHLARAALAVAVPEITNAERTRCAEIVGLARFGEIDQDFRTIIHFIESGSPVEEVKRRIAKAIRALAG